MKAPEKIYRTTTYLDNDKGKTVWKNAPVAGAENTEYTRTDAFIEKACDAYCKVCGHYPHTVPTHICRQACEYYEDFKHYLKNSKIKQKEEK